MGALCTRTLRLEAARLPLDALMTSSPSLPAPEGGHMGAASQHPWEALAPQSHDYIIKCYEALKGGDVFFLLLLLSLSSSAGS